MTDQPTPISQVMSRLGHGDEIAATTVFRRYADRLVALARSRLQERLRGKEDAEDVVQSVFKSFFRQAADGGYDCPDWESLWSLLTVITLRKCGKRAKRFNTTRRDVRREVALTADAAFPADFANRDPSPVEAAMLTELVEQIMRDTLPDHRGILTRSLSGRTVAEISEELSCTERTVQRVLRRTRQQLEKMCVEPC